MTIEEMSFYLAVLSLIAATVITLAKIVFLHINPNGNGNGIKPPAGAWRGWNGS